MISKKKKTNKKRKSKKKQTKAESVSEYDSQAHDNTKKEKKTQFDGMLKCFVSLLFQ